MRDLVAEMSNQGSIRLAHFPPAALALGIVRFGQIDRNHPAVVAGHDRISCRRALRAEEIEGETLLRVIDPGFVREPQLEKRIEQAVLGGFDLAPVDQVVRLGEIGNCAIVSAGNTEALGARCRDQPIADAMLGIGATAITRPIRQSAPSAAIRIEGGHGLLARQIAELAPAAFTAVVLEIKWLSTMLAFEKLHDWAGFRRPVCT